MTSRKAACENCSRAKLRCDHGHPACSRCMVSGKKCVYRVTPFQRKRVSTDGHHLLKAGMIRRGTTPSVSGVAVESTPAQEIATSLQAPHSHTESTGHLGAASHATIFERIPGTNALDPSSSWTHVQHTGGLSSAMSSGAEILDRLCELWEEFPFRAMKDLVSFWISTGANLALAEPLTMQCVESLNVLERSSRRLDSNSAGPQSLLSNTKQSLNIRFGSSQIDFVNQFVDANIRYETIGIFLCAVLRASFDIQVFPPLYLDDQRRTTLRRSILDLIEGCLALCLSLGQPNDLLLVFQYEACIAISYVYGDQSK